MNKAYLSLALLLSFSLEMNAVSNVISGNVLSGVLVINNSDDNLIINNAIGTDTSGSLNLGGW